MKQILIVLVLAMAGFFGKQQFFPSDEGLVKRQLGKIVGLMEVGETPNKIMAGILAKKFEAYFDPDIEISIKGKGQTYSHQGRKDLIRKLVIGHMRVINFEAEIFDTSVVIEQNIAMVKTNFRGKGSFIDIGENFSEVHRLDLVFLKKENQWLLQSIQNIPSADNSY